MVEEMVNLNVEVLEEVRRLAKAKAALLGISLDEYVAKIILADTHKQKLEVKQE